MFATGESSPTQPLGPLLDAAFTLDCELPSTQAADLALEHSMAQSGLGGAVVIRPLDPDDASTVDRIRAAVHAQKGMRWRIEARRPYDALLESVSAPDDVTFEPGTVGNLSGVWVYPTSSRPDQAILHFHGGWFHAGSATAYRRLVGHIAARAG
jgi:epsilon-lactone hydrolase